MLLNREPPADRFVIAKQHEDAEIAPPSFDEVRRALKGLQHNKAAGLDEITTELLKYEGEKLYRIMY